MNVGDVIFWPKFTFQDGHRSNKLLLILSVRASDDARFMIKTTSQEKWLTKYDKDGCHFEGSVHRFKQNLGGFQIPTWVQFDPPIFRNLGQMNAAGAQRLFTMRENDLRAVINCYKKSDDCSDKLASLLPN